MMFQSSLPTGGGAASAGADSSNPTAATVTRLVNGRAIAPGIISACKPMEDAMSPDALLVDQPMKLVLHEDASLEIEVAWHEGTLSMRFSPAATDVLADSLADWQARRKLALPSIPA